MRSFPQVLESVNDLDLNQIEFLLSSAKKFKTTSFDLRKKDGTRPVIATCFLENSTRTKNSFVLAAQQLGEIYLNFDPSTSSLNKGENLEETFLTLKSQGVDLCIIRTSIPGDLRPFKKNPPFKLINGGDGGHQHPTQALLDLFTMMEHGLHPQNKTMAIIGDCMHSRVCHSLIDLMTLMGTKIILCGPPGCLPEVSPHPKVSLSHSVEETLKASDLIYLLRIQKERHKKFDQSQYFSDYTETHGVSLSRLKKLDKMVPVFHPGPANIGVEISEDLIKSSLYMGHSQVHHSLFMRMAILKAMIEENPT